MKIGNFYAGLGGNRRLWGGGDEITAIELDPNTAKVYKDNFPGDNVLVEDAHEYLSANCNNFDLVWSSPPCQSHSKMVKATRNKVQGYIDLKLYQEIIFLQHFCKELWVVENVIPYYIPLIAPTATIGRHCFWSNFRISKFENKNKSNFIMNDTPAKIEELKKMVGIKYEGNIYYNGNHSPGQVLRNCVSPEIGQHVLQCALGNYNYMKTTQTRIHYPEE